MKKAIPHLLLGLSLGILPGTVFAASQADYDKALQAAKAAQQKAASVDGEWRDMGKMLKEADKLAEAGKFEEATALVRTVEQQGHRGYEQMTSQAGKVGPEPYMQ